MECVYLSNLLTGQIAMKKYLSTVTLIASWLLTGSVTQAQTSSPSTQTSTVGDGSSGNTVVQTNPQNSNSQTNGQTNSQTIVYPSIPLSPTIQNPVNTENDFGLNLGGALNTLDGRNMTLYLGITYQPGRTDDHNARMAKLKSETQVLESQRQMTQAQLELLKKQVAEQELRLRRMQSSGQNLPK
jgi:hypothetical protein